MTHRTPVTSGIQPLRLLAEALAIVVSILLAFWIDAWWEEHKERQAERTAIENLTVDFHENLRQLRMDRQRQREAMDAAVALLGMVGPEPDAALSAETLAPLLVSCLTNSSFEPRLGTLNSLIYSGRLQLLRDVRLRALLTEFPSAAQDLNDWQRVERQNTEQYMLRFTFDYVALPDIMVALASSQPTDDSSINLGDKQRLTFAASRFDSDFSGLLGSLRFEGMLTNRQVNLSMLIDRVNALEEHALAILERLGERDSRLPSGD